MREINEVFRGVFRGLIAAINFISTTDIATRRTHVPAISVSPIRNARCFNNIVAIIILFRFYRSYLENQINLQQNVWVSILDKLYLHE